MKQHIERALKLRRWVAIGHHFPGRVRLKYKLGIVAQLASIKSADVERVLADIPAFHDYKVNSSTGSIVVEYDAEMIEPQWIDQLFSESDAAAEQACYQIAQQLTMDGAHHE